MYPFLKSWIAAKQSVNFSNLDGGNLTNGDHPPMENGVSNGFSHHHNDHTNGISHHSNTNHATMNGSSPSDMMNGSSMSLNGSQPAIDALKSGEPQSLSPRSVGLKDFGTQVSDLKKENFSLKLRIFYMEERMQDHYSVDQEEVVRSNIELKVECDSLRRELQEKHDLLVKASNAVASMEADKPEIQHRARLEIEQELDQIKDVMNQKLKSAENDLWSARHDAEMTSQLALKLRAEVEELKDENKQLCDELDSVKKSLVERTAPVSNKEKDNMIEELRATARNLEEKLEELDDELEDKDNVIAQLRESLSSKQTVIELLNEEKQNNRSREENSLQRDIDHLTQQLRDKELDLKDAKMLEQQARRQCEELLLLQDDCQEHITEQQQRLNDFEQATRQMTEELDKRQTQLKELKESLEVARERCEEQQQELAMMRSEAEDKEERHKRDRTKRDRAITGLTQMIRNKDEKISQLEAELKDYETKAEELAETVRNFELLKPQTAGKDKLINQLRDQLKQSDAAMQEALDAKSCFEEEQEKIVRDLKLQLKDKTRQVDKIKTQLRDNEEATMALDHVIKEKDEQLQEAANKFKNLTRELQTREDECARVAEEREELQRAYREEKRRLGELTDKLIGKRDFPASDPTDERVWKLEDQLRSKEDLLHEACRARDKLEVEVGAMKREMSRDMQARQDEMADKQQTIATRENKISNLNAQLAKAHALRKEAEDKLESEMAEFIRANDELRAKLTSSMKELDQLRQQQAEKSSFDGETEEHKQLQAEVQQLYKELDARDREIETLSLNRNQQPRPVYILEEDYSTEEDEEEVVDGQLSTEQQRAGDQITYSYNVLNQHGDAGGRPHDNRMLMLNGGENSNVRISEDRKDVHNSVDHINRTTTRNETVNTTIGTNPHFDQTSYMDMPPPRRMSSGIACGDDDVIDMSIGDLRSALRATKNQLSDAIRDLADLNKTSVQQSREIADLEKNSAEKSREIADLEKNSAQKGREIADLEKNSAQKSREIEDLEKKIAEISRGNLQLETKLKQAVDEKMTKEKEVMGLLHRLQDLETERKTTNGPVNGVMRDDVSTDDESSRLSSARSRRRSGDESDGMMTSLSRRELCDVIDNLKKKLKNAEKVNALLKKRVDDDMVMTSSSESTNQQLVIDLASEVERLKEKLREAENNARNNRYLQNGLKEPSAAKSKLPVPVKAAHGEQVAELGRARMLNKKLNERLQATEQTVRQQADRLNKCRAALREAGIVSPPGSPIRAARSVPNLARTSPNLLEPANFSMQTAPYPSGQRCMSDDVIHKPTDDVSTQTAKSDDVMSPRSEQKFNSLIQQQSKELSSLRHQLQRSRTTCKELNSQMDVLQAYVRSLLSSSGQAVDPLTASDVANELSRNRDLVEKMRRTLDRGGEEREEWSEVDSSSDCPSPNLARIHNQQILRLTDQLAERNKLVRELQAKSLERDQQARMTSSPRVEYVVADRTITPFDDVTMRDDVMKRHVGLLTPTSSFHSQTEEELGATFATSDVEVCRKMNNISKYDPHQMSNCSDESRMRMTFQQAITVHEYLPSASGFDTSDSTSDRRSRRDGFSADFRGSWAPTSGQRSSPRKHNKSSSFVTSTEAGETSCDDVTTKRRRRHQLEREVERLRRRLTDSKRINRSLKEELDIASKSLLQSRDRTPGYRRPTQAHHPTDLLIEHLSEIRSLRQRLESTIEHNDHLRDKLELQLQQAAAGVSTNIYVTGDDATSRDVTDRKLAEVEAENRKLRDEMRRDKEQHGRELKDLERDLAAEWGEKERQLVAKSETLTRHVSQLQRELEEQTQLTSKLGEQAEAADVEIIRARAQAEAMEGEKREADIEAKEARALANKYEDELSGCRNQLDSCEQLISTLKSEVALYDKLQHRPPFQSDLNIAELFDEIRSLRVQLERSIEANSLLRHQLEQQLMTSRSGKKHDDVTTINIHHLTSPPRRDDVSGSARRKLNLDVGCEPNYNEHSHMMTPPTSSCSDKQFRFDDVITATSSPDRNHDRPYYCEDGLHTMCTTEVHTRLRRIVHNTGLLSRALCDKLDVTPPPDHRSPKSPLHDVGRSANNVRQQVELARQLLVRDFWPVGLLSTTSPDQPSSSSGVQTRCTSVTASKPDEFSLNSETDGLRKEVGKLRERLTTQDRLLQSTVERLQTTNRLKEGIEDAIVKQLSRTHDVIKKARGNLEGRVRVKGKSRSAAGS